MSTMVFVQARLGSTRLPGKSLADILGKPALQRIVERVGRAPGIDGVAVLTSTAERDRPIVELCAGLAVPCVTGSEEDVLARFAQGVAELGVSRFVRVTADCPLIDAECLGRLTDVGGVEHVSVATGAMAARPGLRRYPDGLDAELVSAEALLTAHERATDPYEREHVTPYIWRRPDEFRLGLLEAPEDWGAERWTVDHAADLDFVRAVFARLRDPEAFGVRDVLDVLAREPALRAINASERAASEPVR
jgi:spore coat polysaccharide biosynthesis protein SpsF (cytidylyltransferase family)